MRVSLNNDHLQLSSKNERINKNNTSSSFSIFLPWKKKPNERCRTSWLQNESRNLLSLPYPLEALWQAQLSSSQNPHSKWYAAAIHLHSWRVLVFFFMLVPLFPCLSTWFGRQVRRRASPVSCRYFCCNEGSLLSPCCVECSSHSFGEETETVPEPKAWCWSSIISSSPSVLEEKGNFIRFIEVLLASVAVEKCFCEPSFKKTVHYQAPSSLPLANQREIVFSTSCWWAQLLLLQFWALFSITCVAYDSGLLPGRKGSGCAGWQLAELAHSVLS